MNIYEIIKEIEKFDTIDNLTLKLTDNRIFKGSSWLMDKKEGYLQLLIGEDEIELKKPYKNIEEIRINNLLMYKNQ